MSRLNRLATLGHRTDLQLIAGALLLTGFGGVLAVALPGTVAAVIGALGAAIVLLLASLVHRQRSGARLTAAALESALVDAARAITQLEQRADRLERAMRLTRSIARAADELPAWIALANHMPLQDAALQRGIDPRTLLVLTDRLAALDVDVIAGARTSPTVLILADDPIGSIAARTVVRMHSDARAVVLTSTAAGTERLRALLGDDLLGEAPRIELRAGSVDKRSFGRIAGPWFAANDLAGLEGVRLVLVAGPSAETGAAARHAVVAGVLELTSRATLIIDSPDERFVSRAAMLWPETAPEGARLQRVSPWLIEVELA